jgi:hypothetical protein
MHGYLLYFGYGVKVLSINNPPVVSEYSVCFTFAIKQKILKFQNTLSLCILPRAESLRKSCSIARVLKSDEDNIVDVLPIFFVFL